MQPYTHGTEMFENGIIYTIRYPTIADELLEAEPALHEAGDPDFAETKKKPIPGIDEMLKRVEERYSFKPRSEAREGQWRFIALAIQLSRQYEISMEIRRSDRAIHVMMDVYYAPYFGAVKQMLNDLFCMATECTFIPKQDGYVTSGLEYALFDRYDNRTREKVDW